MGSTPLSGVRPAYALAEQALYTLHSTRHAARCTQHSTQHAAHSTCVHMLRAHAHAACTCTCCVHMHKCCVHFAACTCMLQASHQSTRLVRGPRWTYCASSTGRHADTLQPYIPTPYNPTPTPCNPTPTPCNPTPTPRDTLQPYADTLQPYADTLQAYARLQPHLAEAATPRVPAATVCTKAAPPRRISSPQPSWHPRRMAWCAPVRRTGCSWSTPRSAGGRLARYVSSGGEVGKVRDEQGSK